MALNLLSNLLVHHHKGIFMPFFFFALVIILMFLLSFINILKEYERGVIFTLGRFWKVKGPGLIIVIRGLQEMIRVDLRTVVMDVPTQDIITKDNVTTKVNAVVYFRVMDPKNAVIQVENYYDATVSWRRLRFVLFWGNTILIRFFLSGISSIMIKDPRSAD